MRKKYVVVVISLLALIAIGFVGYKTYSKYNKKEETTDNKSVNNDEKKFEVTNKSCFLLKFMSEDEQRFFQTRIQIELHDNNVFSYNKQDCVVYKNLEEYNEDKKNIYPTDEVDDSSQMICSKELDNILEEEVSYKDFIKEYNEQGYMCEDIDY